MTMGDRIRYLRKYMGLNQTDFGLKIGVGQTTIGMYENNLRNVTERSAGDICRVFSVNELWLKNGLGDIFKNAPTTLLDKYLLEQSLSNFDIELIKSYISLDFDTRKNLYIFFKKIINSIEKQTAYDSCPKSPDDLEHLFPPVDTKNTKMAL